MNIIENIEKEQISKLMEGKNVPSFKPGDTLKVHTKVKEGDRERIQIYEGVCIARKNDGLNSSFTVRKISFGEGVERVFPLYSPNVAKIEVERIGKVRRAKLYFLRALRGRSARIADGRRPCGRRACKKLLFRHGDTRRRAAGKTARRKAERAGICVRRPEKRARHLRLQSTRGVCRPFPPRRTAEKNTRLHGRT